MRRLLAVAVLAVLAGCASSAKAAPATTAPVHLKVSLWVIGVPHAATDASGSLCDTIDAASYPATLTDEHGTMVGSATVGGGDPADGDCTLLIDFGSIRVPAMATLTIGGKVIHTFKRADMVTGRANWSMPDTNLPAA